MGKAVKVTAGDEIKAQHHNDLVDDILNLEAGHVHSIADIDGLQTALNSKANASSLAAKADKAVVDALVSRIEALEAVEEEG